MGVVYSAHDDAMGRPVAVKVLMGDLESDPETRKRFYREAQAAAGLLHPNIITIYDAGEDQGRSYIAMQLLEGWPLSTFLTREGVVPLEAKLDLMVQICEGLAVAHGRGIVHRDLKPGNLFVQSDGLLKILDFGVARLADSSMTSTGMMLGTPDYMSPEQALGIQVDTRSDIFSVGAVFYFMLAGRKPFPGPDLPAVLRQLQEEQPAPLTLEQAPPDLARLVTHAMAKAPIDRPQRVQDLLAGIVRLRRQYEAGARKLAGEAGARYAAVVAALDGVRRTGAALGLPAGDDPVALQQARSRYPAVAERGGAGLDVTSADRASLERLIADLRADEERLGREAAQQSRAAEQLAAASAALTAGDPRAALRLVESVQAQYPSAAVVAPVHEAAVRGARELDARDARVQELLAAAHMAVDASEWAKALAACDSALSLSPESPDALRVRRDVQAAMAEAARRRAEEVQRLGVQLSRALDLQQFDDAAALLREVEALDPGAPDVREWQRRLADARKAAARAERLRRETADQIRVARGRFRRGQYEEAVSALHQFAGAHPAAIAAMTEAARLDALHRDVEESGRVRRQEASRLVHTARAAAEAGRWDDAIASAAAAVRSDPASAEAAAALDECVARDLQHSLDRARARAEHHRREFAAQMLAAAHEAQARGFLGAALEAAQGADRVAPGTDEITRYLADLRRQIEGEDETAYELASTPFDTRTEPAREPVEPRPGPAVRPSDGGVLSHVNQWAADLLRRRPSNR
jgi:serine/threonine-protein kinase